MSFDEILGEEQLCGQCRQQAGPLDSVESPDRVEGRPERAYAPLVDLPAAPKNPRLVASTAATSVAVSPEAWDKLGRSEQRLPIAGITGAPLCVSDRASTGPLCAASSSSSSNAER